MANEIETSEEIKPDVLVPDPQVRKEFGDVSEMTTHRWDRDPRMAALGWPPPTYMRARKYRFRGQLERFKQNLLRAAIEHGRFSKTGGVMTDPKLDPFDLESLILSQNFTETTGVKKLLTTVPVRRPNLQDFVRTHPSPDYRRDFLTLELKDDRESYLVRPEMANELAGETVTRTIFTAINRQGVLFLWPVTIPPPDGRMNEWWRSAREGAELAVTRWVRLKANMSLGAYEIFEAQSIMADPEWPELSFQELVRIAFRDRLIENVDHPVVRRLRGLA